MTAKVTLYTTAYCPFCVRAKHLLDSKQVSYTEFAVDRDPELRQEMMRLSQRRTVPQIWIGETHVGGCDELFALERAGQLDEMLNVTH
ncbi:glutaredoxin 3 [Parahaliea sp. F7430]|uniref:Glutaredoxin n=1 Tax=Sediminihaliea albiluteola TaxID=2758564 RepID=A0A7W2YK89_9GAMM|nr:glutaredoxin 3 [Sediminihaliea albiluteola]MBA6413902.1 glutaredoxin 3 [Sediminihaliea albiluteola]